MIATDLIMLLETARKLVERKGELDRAYFEDVIQPAWELFTRVHEDYKSSFRAYTEFLAKPEYSRKELIQRIRRDYIYSEDLRVELAKSVTMFIIYERGETGLQRATERFVAAIRDYFRMHAAFQVCTKSGRVALQYDPSRGFDFDLQSRVQTIIWLSRQKDEGDLDEIRELFDDVVRDLQANYENVADGYYRLRGELLA